MGVPRIKQLNTFIDIPSEKIACVPYNTFLFPTRSSFINFSRSSCGISPVMQIAFSPVSSAHFFKNATLSLTTNTL